MKRVTLHFTALAVLAMSSLLPLGQHANANLVVTPFQVIFEGDERFKEVVIVNTGNETRSYEMEWSFLNMTETTGKYAKSEDAGEGFDLSKHVIFSPRRVTLTPGAKQKVRLRVSRPDDLPNRDHHVHLRFSAVSKASQEKITFDRKNPQIDVDVSVSYAIPVVLRAGDLPMGANIGDIRITRNENSGALNAVVPLSHEKGGAAILSHMYIYHVDGNGKEELVGEVSNANVFPEIEVKEYKVQLNKKITGGNLKIVLKKYDRSSVLVERIFPLQ